MDDYVECYHPVEDIIQDDEIDENDSVDEQENDISKEERFNYYLQLAYNGDVDAQKMIGDMYYNGEGVERDYKEAIAYSQYFYRTSFKIYV